MCLGYSAMSWVKHCLHVLLLCTIIAAYQVTCGGFHLPLYDRLVGRNTDFNPWLKYGQALTIGLYALRFLTFLLLPMYVFSFLGLVLFNAFPGKVRLRFGHTCLRGSCEGECGRNDDMALLPHICFRVPTRGDYKELVRSTLEKNLKTCQDVGLKNYSFQIITQKPLDVPDDDRVQVILVPEDYRCPNGSLYKARNLEYCLRYYSTHLSDSDFIVHIDEETLVTENSVRGICNFVHRNLYPFGHGLITYANDRDNKVVNWLCTFADMLLVTDEVGRVRFQFNVFHRPVYGVLKGSFMVARLGEERDLGLDFGPMGSITEDCYFTMLAYQRGHKFAFVQGEMMELSPFTLLDLLRQRRRWVQGLFLIIHRCPEIKLCYKLFAAVMWYGWVLSPLVVLNGVVSIVFPLNSGMVLNILSGFIYAMTMYQYMYGTLRSMSVKQLGSVWKYLLCTTASIICIPLVATVEMMAAAWAMLACNCQSAGFHVVAKESKSNNNNNNNENNTPEDVDIESNVRRKDMVFQRDENRDSGIVRDENRDSGDSGIIMTVSSTCQ